MKNDHYAQEWEKVANFEKQSLPQSAAKNVQAILDRAIKEKNSPEVIKAYIYQGKYSLMTDQQNDTILFVNLKEMLQKSRDEVEQSVLHSLLGELYQQYYQKDRWNIDQRTDLGDFVPSDMKEWTANLFHQKTVEHMRAAIGPQEVLENTTPESYAAVVELGKDSRRFYPTMYDFLIRRSLEVLAEMNSEEDLGRVLAKKQISQQSLFAMAEEFITLDFDPQPADYGLWVLDTYRLHMESLLKRGMSQSVLLTELDKLNYLKRLNSAHSSYALPLLESLQNKWEGDEMSVEIIALFWEFSLQERERAESSDEEKEKQEREKVYNLLTQTIAEYPSYERISILKNQLMQLTQPSFTVSGPRTFPKEGEKELKVIFRNLRSLTAKLYRINSPVVMLEETHKSGEMPSEMSVLVKEIPIALPDIPAYLEGYTTFMLDIEDDGTYMLTFSSSPSHSDGWDTDYNFSVTNLAIFTRRSSESLYDFFVVDRTTGSPVSNAQINVYKLPGNWQNSRLTLDHSLVTDQLGMSVYDKKIPNHDVFYHAVTKDDNGSVLSRLPSPYYRFVSEESTSQEKTTLFTDRSLYRPGQTVYYKAIQVLSDSEEQSIVAGRELTLVLRDVNNREIAQQTKTTNEFGSVSGEFVLPQGVLPGQFRLETKTGNISFSVEEYKRPTFEVTFGKIEGTYSFGEEVTLKGKAENFSGISLQQATVEYRIERRQMWWRMWGGSTDDYAVGSVITGDDGTFEITFTPQKPDNQFSDRVAYAFEVEAKVTDVNGETQLAVYTVSVGDISMMLSLEMPERMIKERSDIIMITAKNLDGHDVTTEGTYQVFSLQENDSIAQKVAEGAFNTGEQPLLKKELEKLASGKYKVKLAAKDDMGTPVETERNIILFSYSDKRPPIKTNSWFVEKRSHFSPERGAEIILGASEKIYVLSELWQENRLVSREWVVLENENRLFSIPYKIEYKDGVTQMFTHVKDEKFYTHRVDIFPEKKDTSLKVSLDVFRDKTRPGAEEEWRIKVLTEGGDAVSAEVLASMYDYSLDNILPSQDWVLTPFWSPRYSSRMGLGIDQSFTMESANGYIPTHWESVENFTFDRFNWHDYSLYYSGRIMLRGGKGRGVMSMQANEMVLGVNQMITPDMDLEEEIVTGFAELASEPAPPPAAAQSQEGGSPQVRRQFNETAFFFPHLRTNEKGETLIAFTVPESNTKWRFRVLAHDKALNTGKTEAFTVSQKELMVTPNMPRFLRHGDKASISSKISNLSEELQEGVVRIEFYDPLTEAIVTTIAVDNAAQSFSLTAGSSSDASWSFDVPTDVDLLGVRIVAQSSLFSDGEQHALAVLPNRMLVTESMRMDLNGNQTKEFVMDRLVRRPSPTIQDYRLTLEFTSNPAWYAVQALPVLGEPESDNAVSWFASYYANTLGAQIGASYPKVKAMVDAWKLQGGNKETFLSNLEKNQELKNVLLEETPWVLEANNESEQRERLSLLFDLNRNRNLTESALAKLQDLQTNQGGWSWFKGFHPSVSITQYILYGFHQLKELDAVNFSEEIVSMQERAVSYLDAEALRRFEQMKKYNKNWAKQKTISLTDLEYLYVRSAYDEYAMEGDVKTMSDFYLSVVEKNWTHFGIYARSLIAVLMDRRDKPAVVGKILESFREHVTHSEEMGMYWANNQNSVFMSQSAVSVHTFIMEAFATGGASAKEMDEMKRWLLKQKQTQLWETTHATADAIYALLKEGSDWFSTEHSTVVKVGPHQVTPGEVTAGSGYFKESWKGTEITPDMGKVTVAQQGNSPAWGALYWQYYEDMDKIQKTDASLDIEKLLFVERISADGKQQLERITEESPLTVGDKVVVRLTVRSDRDLEFVHLKDMRAAAFEPVSQISSMGWQNGVPYYQTTKDASTGFYFDSLPRGTYLFEYAVYVTRSGSYSNGITTLQCMYAPEFTSHTAGMRIIVKE